MKCEKCGYSDNGTGDWAHVCGPVKVKESGSNERIRECWIKAAREDAGETWDSQEQFIERFAVMIIKKCRDIVSATRDMAIEEEWNVDEAMSTAMYDIEEYFGIEE